MSIKHILFDLDGTLWDSRKEVEDSWSEIIKQYDYKRQDVSFQEINDLMGKTIDEIEDILFPDIFEERRGNGSKRIHWCSMERL